MGRAWPEPNGEMFGPGLKSCTACLNAKGHRRLAIKVSEKIGHSHTWLGRSDL